MPVEALKVLFLDLAVELDVEEARLSKERRRKRPEVPRNVPGGPGGSALTRVLDKTLPSLTTETVRKEDPPISPPALISKPLPLEHPRFPEFWAIYPRRSGTAARKPACAAFSAACRRNDPQAIIDGARRFAIHQTAEGTVGTRFIPQARKWLNNELWTETYEADRTLHKPNTIAGGFALIDAALDRELAQAEARERNGAGNLEALPGLRQSAA